MTKKKKMILLAAAVLCLLIALCICVVSCTGGGEEQGQTLPVSSIPDSGEPMLFTVVLTTEGGKPLEGVGVYFYTDSTMNELLWFAKTDAEGRVSFTEAASSHYVAVLENVPEGYKVEEYYPLLAETTEIVLSTDMTDGDLANITYNLGDVMMNFSVTDAYGNVYVLSDLLAEKQAVVLNFWYLECNPCRAEFPYLQEAYEKYSDKIAVLAMNPINEDNQAIASFAVENGLTFPMLHCDPAWAQAMQLTAYPTTVVIDRYGTIALIHRGSVTEAKVFEDTFAFFTADDYEQTTVENIEDLEIKAAGSDSSNPIEIGGKTSFEVTVEPGQLVYYHLYKLTNINLSINNSNAYVVYNNKTYTASGGTVSLKVTCPDMYTPCKVVFGNSGTTTQTYTVTLTADAGTVNNPIKLSLGDFTVKSKAGNETGVYHTYTPKQDGKLTVQCNSISPSGTEYKIELNTQTKTGGTKQENIVTTKTGEDGSVSITVRKGVAVTINIGAMPDDSNSVPAAKIKCTLSIGEEDEEEVVVTEQKTYAVTVTNESREPLSGVFVTIKPVQTEAGTSGSGTGAASTSPIATNEKGLVSVVRDVGSYDVTLTVPTGYSAETTELTLTAERPYASVKLKEVKIEMKTYTITVTDEAGNPLPGAVVTIGNKAVTANEKGEAAFELVSGTYRVYISPPDGYTADSDGYAFRGLSTKLAVELKAGSGDEDPDAAGKVDYTVKLLDYNGNAKSGVTVLIMKDGKAAAARKTGSDGTITASLVPADYTITLAFSGSAMHYDEDEAVLPEGTTSATIQVIPTVSEEVKKLYVGDAHYLQIGGNYAQMQANAVNYYIFEPTEAGVYRFNTSDPDAILSYWGGSTSFIREMTDSTDYSAETNSFSMEAKESSLPGVIFIIGVTGADECVIEVSRAGDAEKELEAEVYTAKNKVTQQKISASVGSKLIYVDLTGDSQIVKGSDGYYHLDSATGPLLYMNLGTANVTPPYISMYSMLGASGVGGTSFAKTFIENGEPVKKEDYTACMLSYVNCADATYGVYPLNDDLVYMMQNGGEQKGWWDPDNAQYLFSSVKNINLDIAWMFAVCYVPQ